EERSWLTLITCEGYLEETDSYQGRVAVRAVLVSVETDEAGVPVGAKHPWFSHPYEWAPGSSSE
ncbi:MAG: hypothetical protein ACRDG5_10485, partial [Anaerolineales bacterium]